jgi:peptidylprolyl isomerase
VRRFALIVVLCVSLLPVGCGEEESSTGPEQGTAGTRKENATPGEPKVQIPPSPAPKKLVVKDLRKGSGPAIEEGSDEILVDYIGVSYRTGEEFYNTWERGGPSKYHLEEVHRGWELGLKGMRVGGRRELIEPSRLAYGTGPLLYVVDLLAVK